jgi:hypothetical protein
MLGVSNFILPINRNNVQASNLVQNPTTYWERQAGMTLPATMCQDFFNWDAVLDKLGQSPPADLTESYYTCTKSWAAAGLVAFGTGYSVANVFCGTLWVVCGIIIVQALKRSLRNSPSRLVSASAKADLHELFEQMKSETLVDTINCLVDRIDRQEEIIQSLLSNATATSDASRKATTSTSELISRTNLSLKLDRFRSLFLSLNDAQFGDELSRRMNALNISEEELLRRTFSVKATRGQPQPPQTPLPPLEIELRDSRCEQPPSSPDRRAPASFASYAPEKQEEASTGAREARETRVDFHHPELAATARRMSARLGVPPRVPSQAHASAAASRGSLPLHPTLSPFAKSTAAKRSVILARGGIRAAASSNDNDNDNDTSKSPRTMHSSFLSKDDLD